jgi:hypothetical protein
MTDVRLTHNAVAGYRRLLAPGNSSSGAYSELKQACAQGRYEREAPSWLRRVCKGTDGYLLLDGDLAALPVRRGRVVACLVNPLHGVEHARQSSLPSPSSVGSSETDADNYCHQRRGEDPSSHD